MGAIKVAVQERQRFFREGLEMVLAGEPDIEVVGAVASATELVSVCEAGRPDVVLLEIDADGWDPCRLSTTLRKRSRALRIVGIAGAGSTGPSLRGYQAGIRSVVARDGGVAPIVHAIRHVPRSRTEVTVLPAR